MDDVKHLVATLRRAERAKLTGLPLRHAADTIESQAARIAELEAGLHWYGEQSRLCRLIHSDGDAGRHALESDGGERARALLNKEGE